MKWSWRILRIAGIGIYVHFTFLLLPLWIGFTFFSERHQWIDAALGVGFVFLLFVIVVLHELGHAITARRFGIRTRDITLLPIGGLARLERMPEDPKQELLVALAGPAVNVCLAVLLFAAIGAGGQLERLAYLSLAGSGWLATFMWVNIVLAAFNLVPAFPLDGGRVLRALLATRMNYPQATRIAASVGQGLALVLAFLGLASIVFGRLGPLSNPFLLLIALFVWMAAGQEAEMVRMKSALSDVPVGRLMITDFRSISPSEPLARVADYLLSGWQRDFPVVENGRFLGILTHGALVDGLAQLGEHALVSEVALRVFPLVDPAEPAERALLKLRTGENGILLAATDGRLLGIVTSDKISEYMLIRAALNRTTETGPGWLGAEKEAA